MKKLLSFIKRAFKITPRAVILLKKDLTRKEAKQVIDTIISLEESGIKVTKVIRN